MNEFVLRKVSEFLWDLKEFWGNFLVGLEVVGGGEGEAGFAVGEGGFLEVCEAEVGFEGEVDAAEGDAEADFPGEVEASLAVPEVGVFAGIFVEDGVFEGYFAGEGVSKLRSGKEIEGEIARKIDGVADDKGHLQAPFIDLGVCFEDEVFGAGESEVLVAVLGVAECESGLEVEVSA